MESDEKIKRFDLARRISDKCPIGWREGHLIFGHGITQQDIIQWICDLQNTFVTTPEDPETLTEIQKRY